MWWRWGIEWIWMFIGTAMLIEGGLKVSFASRRRKLVAWWLLAGGLRELVGVGMVLFGLAGLFGFGGH